MAWAATVAAGVAVVGSSLLSDKAGASAGQASQAANASNEINAKLAGISAEQWDLYKQNALPMLKEAAAQRSTPDRTNEVVSQAAGDVKDQYAGARQNTMRALSMVRNPADPGYADVLARSYGDEAGAVSRAMTGARVAERARVENTNWDRRLQAIQGFQNLPNQVGQNAQAASAGYRGTAGVNSNLAGMYGQGAGQMGYAATYLGSDAARRWFNGPGSTGADPNAGYNPVNYTGGGGGPDASGLYYDNRDYAAPASVGMPAGGNYSAKDGGAITRRGVRTAIPHRPPRRRTFEGRVYERRYAEGGFVDQGSLDFIRNGGVRAAYDLTGSQKAALAGTPYENAPAYVQQEAIASRMLAGDPKFAPQTEQQRSFLNMAQQYRQSGDAGYMHRDWMYDGSHDQAMMTAAGSAPTMPGTGAMDSDWARAEAERLYSGGQGVATADFRVRPQAIVSAPIADHPYTPASAPGGSEGTADAGTSAAGADAGAGASGGDGSGDYNDGGPIRGRGTGTSDSIKAKVRPGAYILSADTVRAIGHSKIDKIMEQAGIRPGRMGGNDPEGVAVRLSNGEYELPPEVVAHHGEEFFNKLQQKYHRPVRADEGGVANGGAIRRRQLPRSVEDAIFRSVPARAIGRRG